MSSRSDHDSIEAPRRAGPEGSGGSCPERGPGREGPIDGAAGRALARPGARLMRSKWFGTGSAAAAARAGCACGAAEAQRPCGKLLGSLAIRQAIGNWQSIGNRQFGSRQLAILQLAIGNWQFCNWQFGSRSCSAGPRTPQPQAPSRAEGELQAGNSLQSLIPNCNL